MRETRPSHPPRRGETASLSNRSTLTRTTLGGSWGTMHTSASAGSLPSGGPQYKAASVVLARIVPAQYWHVEEARQDLHRCSTPSPNKSRSLESLPPRSPQPASPYLKRERRIVSPQIIEARDQQAVRRYKQELRDREALRQKLISRTLIDVERQQEEHRARLDALEKSKRKKILDTLRPKHGYHTRFEQADLFPRGWILGSPPEKRASWDAISDERRQRREAEMRLRLERNQAAIQEILRQRTAKVVEKHRKMGFSYCGTSGSPDSSIWGSGLATRTDG